MAMADDRSSRLPYSTLSSTYYVPFRRTGLAPRPDDLLQCQHSPPTSAHCIPLPGRPPSTDVVRTAGQVYRFHISFRQGLDSSSAYSSLSSSSSRPHSRTNIHLGQLSCLALSDLHVEYTHCPAEQSFSTAADRATEYRPMEADVALHLAASQPACAVPCAKFVSRKKTRFSTL